MTLIIATVIFLMSVALLLVGIIAHFNKHWKGLIFSLSVIGFLTGIFLILSSDSIFKDFFTGNQPISTIDDKVPSDKNKEDGKENPIPETAQVPKSPEPATDPPSSPENPEPAVPEKIIIPDEGTVHYVVIKGDTLWSISQRSNVSVSKIKQWNSLTSDIIHVGQILNLYGKNNEPASNPIPPKSESPESPSTFITHGNEQQKEIALTFDAGSDIAGIKILDILKKHNVKATFFLTGKWVEKFPEYAKQIVNDGHEIANHSYSHPDAAKISNTTFMEDIKKAEQIIIHTTGVSPRPFFRFPYGSYNKETLEAVGKVGYKYSIQWSLDTIDWQQPSVDTIVSRIENGASNGDIILMHIGGVNTPDAVDKIIPILKSKGYQLVTISQVLE